MEQLILLIPNLLGIDPGQFALWLVVIVTVANVVSKLIPESATGWLGVVRKIASIVGIALANRITPNVSSKDISKAIAAGIPDSTVKEAADKLQEAVNTGFGSAAFAEAIVDVGIPKTTVGDRLVESIAVERQLGGE
jgi:hypothetical protein